MKGFDNSDVRRQDRLLPEEEAVELLRKGEYGFLSMIEDGDKGLAGYGIPLSFVWDGESSVYIHCALEGHKLVCLDQYPRASFCIVGKTKVVPNKFTTAYQSVLLRCCVHRSLEEEERKKGLKLIVEKYASDFTAVGMKYIEKSFHRTELLRLDIESVSGKQKIAK